VAASTLLSWCASSACSTCCCTATAAAAVANPAADGANPAGVVACTDATLAAAETAAMMRLLLRLLPCCLCHCRVCCHGHRRRCCCCCWRTAMLKASPQLRARDEASPDAPTPNVHSASMLPQVPQWRRSDCQRPGPVKGRVKCNAGSTMPGADLGAAGSSRSEGAPASLGLPAAPATAAGRTPWGCAQCP
jgi:hypothetical protein